MEITDKSFWERYWGTIKLPKKVDFTFKNDRVIAQTILDNIPVADENQTALEIGCAPGKWMILLNDNKVVLHSYCNRFMFFCYHKIFISKETCYYE